MTRGDADAELLREVIAVAPDAVLVVDDAGTIVLANTSTEAVFGHAPEDLLGQCVDILVPERFRGGHHGNRAGYSRRPMGSLELSGVRKDDTEFPAEISLAPILHRGQELVCAMVRDVTERRRSQQRFRNLVEAAPDALVIVDDTATIVLVNRQVENVFGHARDDLIGEKIEVLVPARFQQVHQGYRDRFLECPTVRPMGSGMELFGVRKDGTEFPVEISLSPLETEEGVLVSASVRDITERRRLEQESERIREEFIASMSHELRTPLTSIIGYAELMADLGESEMGAAAHRLLRIIERNATRELRLVQDLLDVTSLRKNQGAVSDDPVDLALVAQEAVESARVLAEAKQLELSLNGRTSSLVAGDAHRLAQVLDNLLSNAVKFTEPGGRIRVRLDDADGMAVLEVEDTGRGLSAEEQRHVFERLYRAPAAVDAHIPGVGLGLAIVQAIVDQHGGTIDIASEPGVGTRFRVALPNASAP